MMRAWVLLAAIALMGISAGCNTTKGAGKDIENTGSNIQRGVNSTTGTANNTTSNMSNTGNASRY